MSVNTLGTVLTLFKDLFTALFKKFRRWFFIVDTDMNLSLIPDTPIQSQEEDHLEVNTCVERVRTLILQADSKDSCSIAVYDDWGKGKTSFLKLLQKSLKADSKDTIFSLFYPAWRFDSDNSPMKPLVGMLKNSLSEEFGKTKNFLKIVLAAIELQAKIKIPVGDVGIKVQPQNSIEEGRKQKEVPRESWSLEYHQKFEEFKGEDSDVKIVLYIDDLDRCQPQKAMEFLEGIKQVFDRPGFFVVMGLNREVLNQHISKRLHESNLQDISIERYLEKFFKVEIDLEEMAQPKIDNLINHLLQNKIIKKMQLEKGLEEDFRKSIFDLTKTSTKNNPRAVKKLLNELILILNNAKDIKKTTLDHSLESYFGVCFKYAAPTIFKELNSSNISRDGYQVLRQRENPHPYLTDYCCQFAPLQEAEAAIDLLNFKEGKKWFDNHDSNSKDADSSFLLKEDNLTSPKINQFLFTLFEEYVQHLHHDGKDKPIKPIFNEDHSCLHVKDTLKCLANQRVGDLKIALCLELARKIFIHYSGHEGYVMSGTNIRIPKNKQWLQVFDLSANMLLPLISSDGESASKNQALLLYSAFSEVVLVIKLNGKTGDISEYEELFSLMVKHYRDSLSDDPGPFYLLQMVMNITSFAATKIKDRKKTKYFLEVLKEIKKENPLLTKSFTPQLETLQRHCEQLLYPPGSSQIQDKSFIYEHKAHQTAKL